MTRYLVSILSKTLELYILWNELRPTPADNIGEMNELRGVFLIVWEVD